MEKGDVDVVVEDGETVTVSQQKKNNNNNSNDDDNESEMPETGLKVLFLSSDTGGGHRASAESLGRQFELLYPGSKYVLMDVVSGVAPLTSNLETKYKHLSAHPSQWRTLYNISNTRAVEFMFDMQNAIWCEKACRQRIQTYNPDVVVSVHPMMTNLPTASCAKLSAERNRHLPVFTVVTDLGSAHCLWFCNGVDKLFIASDPIRTLAMERGKVPEQKIVQIGLPIRHDFSVQSDKLGDRYSPSGKAYQTLIRQQLSFTPEQLERKTILVMGGGEGVGSLSSIVDALYIELITKNIDANILVVCGRNQKLKEQLDNKDWEYVYTNFHINQQAVTRSLSEFSFSNCYTTTTTTTTSKEEQSNNAAAIRNEMKPSNVGYFLPASTGCIEGGVADHIRRILSSSSLSKANAITAVQQQDEEKSQTPPIIDEEEEQQQQQQVTTTTTTDGHNIMQPSRESNDDLMTSAEAGEPQSQTATTTKITDNTNSIEVNLENEEKKDFTKVSVIGLGFVNNMAEYMVASDILVTKAGPGTIAEAASLSLPVLLTSFLPGQEEGNVDFVENGEFGTYIEDRYPHDIAAEVASWCQNEEKLQSLSQHAKRCGAPNAARDIVSEIGSLAMRWKRLNQAKDRIEKEEAELLGGKTNITLSLDMNESGNTITPS